jgi:hypothetical protein
VTNHMSQTLVDVAIVTAGGYQVLGKLEPGHSAMVNVAPTVGSGGAPQLDEVFQSIGQTDGTLTTSITGGPSFGSSYAPPGGASLSIRGIRRTLGIRGGFYGGGRGYYNGYGYNGSGAATYYSLDGSDYGSGAALPLWQQEENVASGIFTNGSMASYAPVVLVGWTTSPLTSMQVNGATPRRFDLNMIVTALPLVVGPGSFSLGMGMVLPHIISTSSTTPSNGSGLNLSPGDTATFEFDVPYNGRRVSGSTLDLALQSSGSDGVSSGLGELWNWQQQRWTTIDISALTAHIGHAAAFVSPSGVVRFRMTAPSTGSVSLNDVNSTIQMGMTGKVE